MLSRIKFNHFDRKKWSIEMKISSKERDKSYLKGFEARKTHKKI
jgi:hypothetical protein